MAHGNEINNKRFYWLKMDRHFFNDARIKKMRKLPKGDTCVIIYMKLLLLSVEYGGVLVYEHIEDTFEKEMALKIEEKDVPTEATIQYLKEQGMLVPVDEKDDEFFLIQAQNSIGSETKSNVYKRQKRGEKEWLEKFQPSSNQIPIDIDTDIDKEVSKKVSRKEGRDIYKNKSSTGACAHEEGEAPETYDSIMEQYGIEGAVRDATIEFIRHCQINKKTLTNDALKRILQSLITYPTDEEKIKVLQRAVDEKKFTIQPKVELHDDEFGTAGAFTGKTYQDILDGDLVRLTESVKSKLWEFIRHCKANGLVLTNERLFDLCMKLNRQYGYGKSEEQVEALDRAIAGGYFDIKTEESIAEKAVRYHEMKGDDPLGADGEDGA